VFKRHDVKASRFVEPAPVPHPDGGPDAAAIMSRPFR
jgi:hypothetical protein